MSQPNFLNNSAGMELPLDGSATHKALVMVIERLQALEAVVDRLAAETERQNDPLRGMDSAVELLHVKRAHQYLIKHKLQHSRYPLWRAPSGFHRMPCDMSCPKLQAQLQKNNVSLWRRTYDPIRWAAEMNKLPGTAGELEESWKEESELPWYVAFNDNRNVDSHMDKVSTWKRVV